MMSECYSKTIVHGTDWFSMFCDSVNPVGLRWREGKLDINAKQTSELRGLGGWRGLQSIVLRVIAQPGC